MLERKYEWFLDKAVDLLKKDLKIAPIITPIEFKGVTIDMPKKENKLHHGSSYEILCNNIYTWCKIRGDLVVDEKDEETTYKTIEKSNCRVFDTHKHYFKKEGEEQKMESHIHFMCIDKDREDTIRMIQFLKSR